MLQYKEFGLQLLDVCLQRNQDYSFESRKHLHAGSYRRVYNVPYTANIINEMLRSDKNLDHTILWGDGPYREKLKALSWYNKKGNL